MTRTIQMAVACVAMLIATADQVPADVRIYAHDDEFLFGSLTRVTAQGLDFLDLSITNGRTFKDVLSHLGVGCEFEGFQFATESQVITHIKNYGFMRVAEEPLPISGDAWSSERARESAKGDSLDTRGRSSGDRRTGRQHHTMDFREHMIYWGCWIFVIFAVFGICKLRYSIEEYRLRRYLDD